MNDRFKFRLFNKAVKKFIYFDNSELCIDKENMGLLFRSEHLYLGNYEELQQCTGLKDKNGKLIYEGDIVRFQYGNGYRIGAVEVDKCDWRISNSNFCQGAWCGGALICLYETCEIIGNIYENKELIDEHKK